MEKHELAEQLLLLVQRVQVLEQRLADMHAEKTIPNQVFETMTRYKPSKSITIRVWREEPELKVGPDEELMDALMAANKDRGFWTRQPQLRFIEAVKRLPRVAAVEVLNADGDGGLCYPDWK